MWSVTAQCECAATSMNMPLCHHLSLAGPAEEGIIQTQGCWGQDRCHICSILMKLNHVLILVILIHWGEKIPAWMPGWTAYKNVTVNHFVHHVPCYTMTIQRIHYWPAGSLLWLILRMIGVAKMLHNHIFNAEVSPPRLSNVLPLLLQGG